MKEIKWYNFGNDRNKTTKEITSRKRGGSVMALIDIIKYGGGNETLV